MRWHKNLTYLGDLGLNLVIAVRLFDEEAASVVVVGGVRAASGLTLESGWYAWVDA